MALDNAPTFPEDMYATREEGAAPLPTAPRKPMPTFRSLRPRRLSAS